MDLQSLIDLLPDLTPNDRALVERAYFKAETAHAGQFRKSGEPYFTHCVAVAHILAEMKLDAEAIAAALMHDVVEDTNVTTEELRVEFGSNIAAIVEGVTKLKKLPIKSDEKKSRNIDREMEYIRKMALAMGDDVRVVLVKLADRLHNMRTLGYMSPDKQRVIAQETLDIFAPLANRLGIWQIKWELEDLSFRYLDSESYRQIASSIDERRADREAYLNRIIDALRKELVQYGIHNPIISARPKHIYSIFKKMDRKGLPFDQIYDVRAVRVIVETKPECYIVLGVVHNLWRPIPNEFDDYIAAPKDNFYQSLHTAVLDSNGKTVEVQIRTKEMHEHAEYGIAAHWRYKEGTSRSHDDAFERRIAFLRRLMEFGRDTEDAASFVDTMKTEVFQDRVYAFTPKGDIVDMPKGATPVDFAYYIHTDIGHRCRGAKVHGKLVSLNYMLKTGDQVEIVVSKRGGPSLDWLNPNLGFVTTARAREKIRYWFRKQNRDKNILSGREVLEREMKRLGVLDVTPFETVAKWFGYEKLDDFLANVGAGDINGGQIANKILEIERREQEELERTQLKAKAPTLSLDVSNGVNIMGTGGLLVNMGRCCNPMPGDKIVGFVTRGRGVTVHRSDCVNVAHETDRLIEVAWGRQSAEQRYSVPVEIIAYDREGLMRDISTMFADERVNMSTVIVNTRHNIATFHLTIELNSLQQLTRILTRLENIPSVTDARRRSTI
ncbi:MAG: bifunctional (p)ppGpp synthetase/guanosine-3',5'-bis(diphosphate) 3'-pyrophosphohydrolase [Anaerolineae bacterium]|nr:bifunctional (p)ppGpp synthetase/guanosine-3',5'-bis(diphosphate) 3'-pyrophosphohydrolase [Chloroflexota bacterium]MBN8633913.1 bifunctional (p)ppGpp synthetase/guanosine-3',5'-bis(diphosphate) 3'-pyrophosphohydrolase [Anaerolineae bacterium]